MNRYLLPGLLIVAACAPPERDAEMPREAEAAAVAPLDTSENAANPPEADTGWTAGVTRRAGSAVALLQEVRAGRHGGYDRLVFQFADSLPGWHIAYVDRPVRQCGSGDVVPLPGDAWLSIRLEPANAHTEAGRPTVAERDRTFEGGNLKRLKLICDFEAQVEWIAAVGYPGRYRVMTLRQPARLVVDIRSD